MFERLKIVVLFMTFVQIVGRSRDRSTWRCGWVCPGIGSTRDLLPRHASARLAGVGYLQRLPQEGGNQ